MATQDFSQYLPEKVPSAEGMKIGIVVSEWNDEITFALRDGAVETLLRHGIAKEDIVLRYVPGSFELTAGAQFMAGYTAVDAVICLGCVIRGETPHFDYICQGVAFGLTQVTVNFEIPVIFGVLTTLNEEQARERSGGRWGNKGVEAAVTAIKMTALKRHFQQCEKS
ncbi:MAG: 6,7-dimethyl-8-ribityllumazine synthase [Bacteroidales bacterium]|jgi:6,7-dimethyl-8-ribityllumazine synthase|nr:6,7-dimethyl-8-ribityllumazine synthase [Bacteroidales bacterium]